MTYSRWPLSLDEHSQTNTHIHTHTWVTGKVNNEREKCVGRESSEREIEERESYRERKQKNHTHEFRRSLREAGEEPEEVGLFTPLLSLSGHSGEGEKTNWRRVDGTWANKSSPFWDCSAVVDRMQHFDYNHRSQPGYMSIDKNLHLELTLPLLRANSRIRPTTAQIQVDFSPRTFSSTATRSRHKTFSPHSKLHETPTAALPGSPNPLIRKWVSLAPKYSELYAPRLPSGLPHSHLLWKKIANLSPAVHTTGLVTTTITCYLFLFILHTSSTLHTHTHTHTDDTVMLLCYKARASKIQE